MTPGVGQLAQGGDDQAAVQVLPVPEPADGEAVDGIGQLTLPGGSRQEDGVVLGKLRKELQQKVGVVAPLGIQRTGQNEQLHRHSSRSQSATGFMAADISQYPRAKSRMAFATASGSPPE